MPKEILLGSTSVHKIEAVKGVFKEFYPQEEVRVQGVKTSSGIAEQPRGHEETILGALSRLEDAKKQAAGRQFDFVVGIENGIIPVGVEGGQRWFDVGWVVVEDGLKKQALAVSSGVEFPPEFVEEARRRGFGTTTAGAVIAEHTGCDPTDPQKYLTNDLVPRVEILKQALKIAIGRLVSPITSFYA